MNRIPPENQRAAEGVPPENREEVDVVGGVPLGFERLTSPPEAISLETGITELQAQGNYTLPDGTKDGQEKIILTRLEGEGIDYAFQVMVNCKFYIGFAANYDPATTGKYIGLKGPMTTLHLKWTKGIPTQDWGEQDCWVIVGGPGLNQSDTGTDIVSELTFYRGALPS